MSLNNIQLIHQPITASSDSQTLSTDVRPISNVVSHDRYRVCNTVRSTVQMIELVPVITVKSNIFIRSIKTEGFT